MLPFGVTIPATVPQRSEIPETYELPFINLVIAVLCFSKKIHNARLQENTQRRRYERYYIKHP